MTYPQFALLLGVYLVCIALGALANILVPMPEDPRSPKSRREGMRTPKSKTHAALSFLVNSAIIASGLVGVVGLFLCWHLAPWFFAIGIAGKIAISPLNYRMCMKSGFATVFSDIELLLDGAILCLVFFGPARYLYS